MSEVRAHSGSIASAGSAVEDSAEHAVDASATAFFSADYKRHEELKRSLDSNREPLKLDAMRRIVSMVASGTDCSDGISSCSPILYWSISILSSSM